MKLEFARKEWQEYLVYRVGYLDLVPPAKLYKAFRRANTNEESTVVAE